MTSLQTGGGGGVPSRSTNRDWSLFTHNPPAHTCWDLVSVSAAPFPRHPLPDCFTKTFGICISKDFFTVFFFARPSILSDSLGSSENLTHQELSGFEISTGPARFILSHSLARFCFKISKIRINHANLNIDDKSVAKTIKPKNWIKWNFELTVFELSVPDL